jgi:hypothetical protein
VKTVVISQPMYFPWLGLFEQIKIADVFVHYDDVQLPLGRSFMSRVQLTTAQGQTWLTVPVRRKAGQLINEAEIDEATPWRRRHLASLNSAFRDAPFRMEAVRIAESVLDADDRWLSRLTVRSIEAVCAYLDLDRRFVVASEMAACGRGTGRLIDLLVKLGATGYVTGHGAANYLDHPAMEARGIEVSYMDYAMLPYRQSQGPFTPYVTALDAIAHLGKGARQQLVSRTKPWRDFVALRRVAIEDP